MDLSSVEGAVLSGCGTGVGAVRPGEGVFGLRRAFEIAGARGLVLSLLGLAPHPEGGFYRETFRSSSTEIYFLLPAWRQFPAMKR